MAPHWKHPHSRLLWPPWRVRARGPGGVANASGREHFRRLARREHHVLRPRPPTVRSRAITRTKSGTNTDPGDPGSAWTGVAQGLPTEREDTVVAVGCASSSLCVGGAWFGEGLISQGPFADPSPWRVRLAPAVLPSTTSTPRLSHVYLRGHVRRRYGFVTTAGMHAKLGFTFAAAPHMLPLAGVEFFLQLDPLQEGAWRILRAEQQWLFRHRSAPPPAKACPRHRPRPPGRLLTEAGGR